MEYKFELSEQAIRVYEEWINEQFKKYNNLSSFDHFEMGDRFSICFTPTVLGTIAVAIDNHTKEEKLLNDL